MRRRAFVLGASLLAAAGSLRLGLGCAPEEIEDKRRTLLASWGEYLLQTYAEFEAACAELEARARGFCAAPTPETLEGARSAWWSARAPWKRSETFAFGPYADEPIRLGPKLDFWPARPESVEQVLNGTTPLTPESVTALGAPARGMPAVEALLWPAGTDAVAAFQTAPRRCEYLVALAQDLGARARELREAWDPQHGAFLAELTEPGRQGHRYASLHAALGEVVNRMGYTVENMRFEKLGRPLGVTSGGTAQPDKVESPFSGRSIEDMQDNLRGLEQLYFGVPERGTRGLEQYLNDRGKRFGPLLRDKFAKSHAALAAITEPLAVAVVQNPGAVGQAMTALGELQRAIQVDVINALSLTLGFNDNDGD